jgi:hypothetical protein
MSIYHAYSSKLKAIGSETRGRNEGSNPARIRAEERLRSNPELGGQGGWLSILRVGNHVVVDSSYICDKQRCIAHCDNARVQYAAALSDGGQRTR